MQVTLTPHGAELLEAALARGVGRSPEEVVERALETIAREDAVLSEEEKERRCQAVDGMRAFGETHHLTLGPGERIKNLLHQGHKF
jgi:DNA-binding MarR family transcriptional regulator